MLLNHILLLAKYFLYLKIIIIQSVTYEHFIECKHKVDKYYWI